MKTCPVTLEQCEQALKEGGFDPFWECSADESITVQLQANTFLVAQYDFDSDEIVTWTLNRE